MEDRAILIETANPHDLAPDDLLELTDRLADRLPAERFEVAFEEQHGAGGPWGQVLHVWVYAEFARQLGYDVLVDVCKDWLREQFQSLHGKKREKYLNIYDLATGQQFLSLKLNDPDSEFQVEEVEIVPRRRPKGRHRK